ncbi:DNA-directed RNA polymerase subunit L [Halobacteriales archaeon SW_7_71_33]|nr:MAG: DNA-directed RNA polymerase subunit L [Halobacteriales archaeon SW_7_71_33]
MQLRVVENEDRELVIEIGGEDHTFMNVLKSALLETDGVAAATYDVNPEQSGGQTEPLLTIKTVSPRKLPSSATPSKPPSDGPLHSIDRSLRASVALGCSAVSCQR